MASNEMTDEQFEKKIGQMSPNALLLTCLSIGRELGLFQTIEKLNFSGTAAEIAAAAKMKARYTREWLSALASGQILEYDTETEVFSISKERFAMVMEGGLQGLYFTRFTRNYVPLMKSFPEGGPNGFLPWDNSEFDDVLNADRIGWLGKAGVLDKFVDQSQGLREKLESGISVCEAGSNMGYLLTQLAKMFPKSTFTGFDVNQDTIDAANKQATDCNLTNVNMVCHDIYNLPEDWNDKFDYVYVQDIIHDLPFPDRAVKCLGNITKPAGIFSLVDLNIESTLKDNLKNPLAPMMYSISMFYCLSCSLHGGGDGAGTCYGKSNMSNAIKAAGFELLGIVPVPELQMEIHYTCIKN